MARIRIRSIKGEAIVVEVDGHDITNTILGDPWPLVEVAPASNPGQSRVTLTLMGDIDVEVDGEVETQ